MSVPKPALLQMLAVDEIDGIGQCGGRDAGADQIGGGGGGELGTQPGGERYNDR